ncbi:MAG TPA: enoyl-CoA hydratase-related protein [Longimicrobiales bacterium]|nr:enoyl-CoA hydratase-related protein [Longimicrobiales bacterium]
MGIAETQPTQPSGAEGREGPFRHLRLEREGSLRRLILDRPPLNVLDIPMLRELDQAAAQVQADPAAAVLVVTGAGKAFCAGVDVADHTEDRVGEMIEVFHAALKRLLSLELPVVAVLNGAALGGGLEVALACDIVLAREGAKLGQPEIQLGVFPPFAAVVLPRLIGRARAMDLCLTGRTLTAEEGQALGVVQHVFPKDSFADDTNRYVAALAALSPPVLRLTKRAVAEGGVAPLGEALDAVEHMYLDDLMKLEDAREGLAAFLEKRPPVWKGA